MATGKIKDLFPEGNDGSQEGAGTVTETNGGDYVFFTPDDVATGAAPLSAGKNVTFDKNGDTGTNVQKA